MGKNEQYELESLMYDLKYFGFLVIPLSKLYRLLGKGNRAAGTWSSLLDAWEEVDGDREELHILEAPHEMLVLTKIPAEPVTKWAGE